jgi:hypothetical protein
MKFKMWVVFNMHAGKEGRQVWAAIHKIEFAAT